jgi:hypothetical protein
VRLTLPQSAVCGIKPGLPTPGLIPRPHRLKRPFNKCQVRHADTRSQTPEALGWSGSSHPERPVAGAPRRPPGAISC